MISVHLLNEKTTLRTKRYVSRRQTYNNNTFLVTGKLGGKSDEENWAPEGIIVQDIGALDIVSPRCT